MDQQKPTVILVDDEATGMRGFVRSLEASGCRVVQLRGADEAWAYFSQERPKADALILELMVPPGKHPFPKPAPRGEQDAPVPNGGVWVYDGVVAPPALRSGQMPVPMAILTRANGAETLRLVNQAMERHRSAIVRVWFKKDTDPKRFANEFTTWLAAVREIGPPEA